MTDELAKARGSMEANPNPEECFPPASRHELWQRLAVWHPNDPQYSFPFSRRLQQENGWTESYAVRAIEEYRRFLFLSQVAGHVVCPSEDVDQVWHQHLTYTRSYWDELCGKVLGRPLHHQPSKGGAAEHELYADLYIQTLSSYEHWFGSPPDQQVWPPAADRFAPKEMRRADLRKYWLIRRPDFQLRSVFAAIRSTAGFAAAWSDTARFAGAGLMLLFIPAAVPFGPLDWAGPDFLKWYLTLLAGSVVAAIFVRRMMWPVDPDVPESLEYFEAACLKGNWKLAVNAVLAKLLAAKSIVAEPNSSKTLFRLSGTSAPAGTEFERAVCQSLADPAGLTLKSLHRQLRTAGEQCEASLRTQGLLTGTGSYAIVARLLSALIMVAVAGIGVTKIGIGISRGKPVGFLVALLIVPSVLSVWFFLRPRMSVKAQRWLKRQQQNHSGLKESVGSDFRSPDLVALGTALFGAAALCGTQLLPLRTAWQANRIELGSAGCGTTGCGGSGGGCGGGGCGGCGGD